MGIINILEAQTANRIAAGEVVDRPASALKELLENALDAGATRISVEIKGGGRSFLRVTDNGGGIYRDDMPKALLRHATSKICDGADLQEIATYGFRGEALAAISSVSRTEIISRAREETVGTRLTADENGVVMVDTGCPEGTSVIVRDLFYNTPARQKFLKRDATEASACVAVASSAAISRPDVSFSVSVEGERRFYTAGDGKLLPAIYAVYGKAFATGLLPVDTTVESVRAFGFVTSPDQARGSRTMQFFFVNGRPVRSKTAMAALEEAFRSYLPHGKYPGAVLFIDMPLGLTDVNVHPAKLEIKFADERPVFSAVYYAVKNRLSDTGKANPEEAVAEVQTVPQTETRSAPITPPHARPASPLSMSERQAVLAANAMFAAAKAKETSAPSAPKEPRTFSAGIGEEDLAMEPLLRVAQPTEEERKAAEQPAEPQQLQLDERPYWKLLGEAYDAFLIVETEAEVLFIDKHAAHERILYEQLASRKEVHSQTLLSGIPITLLPGEVDLLLENAAYLAEFGFEIEPFGSDTLLVRAVPATLAGTKELKTLLETFASELIGGSRVSFAEKCDRALFTVACKAALKAGIPNDPAHNEWIVKRLLEDESLRFCPHGRPVLHRLPRRELEGYFDR
ncbi:MAG: DNA mismatch repair endonuclease MutL [Oscillospiraceae bacterium]|nr:DNA mismatch repair endonuclease MutL [Oscillospiraceae bacterium]